LWRRRYQGGIRCSLWHLASGCPVGPIKRGDPVLERAYTELFDQFIILDLPEPMYRQTA
jgi:hypothetical protein